MRRTLPLCLLVVSCVLSVAEAAQANRCRRACRAAVDDCVATTHGRRGCKKQLIRACRQHGVAACDITPPTTTLPTPSTTTTTTFPALPTTSSTSTTTTTTSVTTTLPVRDYSGAWTFVGTLAEDSCGTSPGLTETFVISQSGTALEVTVESLPGVTLGGQATGDGFQVSGTFVAAGCTVEVALTAYNDGTVADRRHRLGLRLPLRAAVSVELGRNTHAERADHDGHRQHDDNEHEQHLDDQPGGPRLRRRLDLRWQPRRGYLRLEHRADRNLPRLAERNRPQRHGREPPRRHPPGQRDLRRFPSLRKLPRRGLHGSRGPRRAERRHRHPERLHGLRYRLRVHLLRFVLGRDAEPLTPAGSAPTDGVREARDATVPIRCRSSGRSRPRDGEPGSRRTTRPRSAPRGSRRSTCR